MPDPTALPNVASAAGQEALGVREPWTKRVRWGWVIEAAIGVAIFVVYDRLRDATMGSTHQAAIHTRQIVDAERFLGIYQEHRVQQAFLDWHPFISFWNIYYGTVHFVLPVVALIVLYRRAPARYVRWRNTLMILLGLGLVGFWAYPLVPPRLMPAHFGFVDTAARYYNFGPQQPIKLEANGEPTAASIAAFGNLYTAMPSLHMGWSTWAALALLPVLRHTWLKVLVCLDPLLTLFAIVVTANHWILDAVGGWVALAAAYGLAVLVERLFYRPGQVTSRSTPVSTS